MHTFKRFRFLTTLLACVCLTCVGLLVAACSTGQVADNDAFNDAGDMTDGTGDVGFDTPDSTIGMDCTSTVQCTGLNEVCDPATNTCELLSDTLCVACDNDLNCTSGETCFTNPSTMLSFCIADCLNGTECPNGYRCFESGEIAGKCVPDNLVCGEDPCATVVCDGGQVCQPNTGVCQTPCGTDMDCAPMHCEASSGICFFCLQNEHCEDDQICDVNGDRTCKDCLAATDCEEGFICTVDNRCIECGSDGECTGEKGFCLADDGICVECRLDTHCPMGSACNETTNTCIECTVPSQCAMGQSCNMAGKCVDCLRNEDCMNGVCNLEAGTCIECENSGQCPAGNVCSDNQCVQCTINAECAFPDRPVCNVATNTCVECTDPMECDSGEFCDPMSNACVQCLMNGDCMVGNCIGGQCVGCSMPSDCPMGKLCDTMNSVCVDCLTDPDCGANFCRQSDKTCVQCINDGQCPGAVCDEAAGVCRDCLLSSDCTNQVCNTQTFECVDCTLSSHCPMGVCTSGNVCVECQSDPDCAPDRCNNSVCVECIVDNDCNPGVCAGNNTCIGCRNDNDCSGTDRCLNDECVPVGQCSPACPGGWFCNQTENICYPAPGQCSSDTHCMPGVECDSLFGICICNPLGSNQCHPTESCLLAFPPGCYAD